MEKPLPARQILNPRVTFAEYLQLPEDGNRYEVLEGELDVTPAPGYSHQIASMNIAYRMEAWRRAHGNRGRVLQAPFDVVLADDTIVEPDVLFVSEQTLRLLANGRLAQ